MKCAYLGEFVGKEKVGQKCYQCNHFQCHVVEGVGAKAVPGCSSCRKKILRSDPKFLEKWQDPLEVIDRTCRYTSSIRNYLSGSSVFLIGGGPSKNELPLEKLATRGVWSLAINNVAGHPRIQPQAFVCSDPPSKFSHSIWFDPNIMKWLPTPKMHRKRGRLKVKKGKGHFVLSDRTTLDCPNVWGFRRNPWMIPGDDFFLSNGASWGNQDAGVAKTGQPKAVNTMLLAMRILRHMGAKRVFLIGLDFWMSADHGYSFNQAIDHKKPKDKNVKPKWDNRQYSVVNKWLVQMQEEGTFQRFGMEVFNCFQNSGLRAFPYVPFEVAIKVCQGGVEAIPDLSEWYEKLPTKEE